MSGCTRPHALDRRRAGPLTSGAHWLVQSALGISALGIDAAVNTEQPTEQTIGYLYVMPRYESGPESRRWNVFLLRDESPRISLAGSVASATEARQLASKDKRPLHFAAQAWQQMMAAGVAPSEVPKDVTLT
jgi:hypothetical protein